MLALWDLIVFVVMRMPTLLSAPMVLLIPILGVKLSVNVRHAGRAIIVSHLDYLNRLASVPQVISVHQELAANIPILVPLGFIAKLQQLSQSRTAVCATLGLTVMKKDFLCQRFALRVTSVQQAQQFPSLAPMVTMVTQLVLREVRNVHHVLLAVIVLVLVCMNQLDCVTQVSIAEAEHILLPHLRALPEACALKVGTALGEQRRPSPALLGRTVAQEEQKHPRTVYLVTPDITVLETPSRLQLGLAQLVTIVPMDPRHPSNMSLVQVTTQRRPHLHQLHAKLGRSNRLTELLNVLPARLRTSVMILV